MSDSTPLDFDVIIVGAGPAGCTAAYQLAKAKFKVALLEKSSFPRDKVCGDALSPDVLNQLKLIDPELASSFNTFTSKRPAKQIKFFAPNHQKLEIGYKQNKLDAFVSKRIDFDNFYFQQLKKFDSISIFENEAIETINVSNEKVTVKSKKHDFTSAIILGADGANSVVKSQLIGKKNEKDHFSAGLRQYYKGVKGLDQNAGIELHFYKEILPGYLWIFPLNNNEANVGIGMLSSAISKNKVNLKVKLKEWIETHPMLKERFSDAEALEKPKGFGLPLGSKKRSCSGNRYLLLGDAASLIDPFTGEGIGNAIRSGRIAADHLANAFDQQRFDQQFNLAYDSEIYRRMWQELRISRIMQKMLRFPWLFNYVVKKANKNESFRTLITASLENVDVRKQFSSPAFYFKLLFNY